MIGKSIAPLSRPRTVALGLIFLVVLVTGAWMLQRGTAGNVLPPVHGTTLFDQVRTYVEERYLDTINDTQAYQMAIRGAIQELGDPSSAFLPPARYHHLTAKPSVSNAGIGLDVDVNNGFAFVTNLIKHGPAERAGILVGDRIVDVNGKSVRYWTPDEVTRALHGAVATTVHVTIEHPGSGTTTPLTVKRAILYRNTVRQTAILPGSVGYVSLWAFGDSTAVELSRAVDSLQHSGATSLIVDVRSTSGGSLIQGVHMAELFLDSAQQVVSTHGRIQSDEHDYVATKPQRWPKLPVTVLVDERTAGAAELFAGALQDHDRAVLLGRTTYGSGSVQTVFPLDTDDGLKLTTALWYTPSGRPIASLATADTNTETPPTYKTDDGRAIVATGGITPDMTAGDSVVSMQDVALLRALGKQTGAFQDLVASSARSFKSKYAVTSPDFAVTQPMLDDLYARMQHNGIDVPRMVYSDASPFVSRLLAYWVDMELFGKNAEFMRQAGDDPVIQTAVKLVRGAQTQPAVFDRLAQAKQSHQASAQ